MCRRSIRSATANKTNRVRAEEANMAPQAIAGLPKAFAIFLTDVNGPLVASDTPDEQHDKQR
jgi:hypothetical protein